MRQQNSSLTTAFQNDVDVKSITSNHWSEGTQRNVLSQESYLKQYIYVAKPIHSPA